MAKRSANISDLSSFGKLKQVAPANTCVLLSGTTNGDTIVGAKRVYVRHSCCVLFAGAEYHNQLWCVCILKPRAPRLYPADKPRDSTSF